MKALGFGDNRQNILHDIEIATGAMVFNDEAVMVKIEYVQLHNLGSVRDLQITKDNTLLLKVKYLLRLCLVQFIVAYKQNPSYPKRIIKTTAK